MELTWIGHSCVRLEQDGVVIVIDPGINAPAGTLDDADAVLVTHEHTDHLAIPALTAASQPGRRLPVWTNRSAAQLLVGTGLRVHEVGDGDAFEALGISVSVHGNWHHPVHRDIPPVRNVGFLVGGSVFHPGDALTDPGVAVDALLLPICGRWVPHAGTVVDYVRQLRPGRVIPVHNTGAGPIGLQARNAFLAKDPVPNAAPGTGAPYDPLTVLTPVTI